MKTIDNTIRGLNEFGLTCLTGEACALYMRLLFDVQEKGRKLLSEYWGIPDLQLPPNWNSGAIGSVMLTRQATIELCTFAMLKRYPRVFIYDGHVIGLEDKDSAEAAEWKCETINDYVRLAHAFDSESFRKEARVYRSHSGEFGFRNQHQMSGRVV